MAVSLTRELAQIQTDSEKYGIQVVAHTPVEGEFEIQDLVWVSIDPRREAVIASQIGAADGLMAAAERAMLAATPSCTLIYKFAENFLLSRRQDVVGRSADAEVVADVNVSTPFKVRVETQ